MLSLSRSAQATQVSTRILSSPKRLRVGHSPPVVTERELLCLKRSAQAAQVSPRILSPPKRLRVGHVEIPSEACQLPRREERTLSITNRREEEEADRSQLARAPPSRKEHMRREQRRRKQGQAKPRTEAEVPPRSDRGEGAPALTLMALK